MTKIAGSGSASASGSRSISTRHGSADPDPDPDPAQNVMDPQHWSGLLGRRLYKFLNFKRKPRFEFTWKLLDPDSDVYFEYGSKFCVKLFTTQGSTWNK
jgi:hypothetical protein